MILIFSLSGALGRDVIEVGGVERMVWVETASIHISTLMRRAYKSDMLLLHYFFLLLGSFFVHVHAYTHTHLYMFKLNRCWLF